MKLIKPIYFDLMLRYLLIVALAVFGFFAAFNSLNNGASEKLAEYAEEIIRSGNKDIIYDSVAGTLFIEGMMPELYRYEILSDNKVIYAEGPVLGGEVSYSPEEINSMIQRHYQLMPEISYIPEYFPFTGLDGNAYALLIKKPKTVPDGADVKKGILIPEYLRGSDLEKDLNFLIWRTIIFAVSLLIIIAVLFSRLTTSKIIKPLRALRSSLKKVNSGSLDVRLDYSANIEFEDVRDAFNRMLDRLESSEMENRRLQSGKKQFILDLSHDLKTPITTIQGYSEALCSGLVEDEKTVNKYLSYINKKSRILSDLINKLFDYSRLDNDKKSFSLKNGDLAQTFREAIINHMDGLEEKEFEINIDIPENSVGYNFDKIEMERAVGNIITNQIKYNPAGTRVSYSLIENENEILMTLSDDGIGIDSEIKDRIFELMFREDSSRNKVEGTGLGLSITRKVIELHEGEIFVESEKGGGSSFIIRLKKK